MITSCLPDAGRLAFLQGKIQPTHRFKVALYTKEANLDRDTVSYTKEGEVVAQGYKAQVIPGQPVFEIKDHVAIMRWEEEVTWDKVTISADGCIIFDADMDNLVLVVGAFDRTISSTEHKFTVLPSTDLITFANGA